MKDENTDKHLLGHDLSRSINAIASSTAHIHYEQSWPYGIHCTGSNIFT